ncbi:hypothetical protein EJ04DRAFT_179073 [Polyplosphaeria fusca]|uniref:Uncharacterized protein n=1 Tax=Polyplosphaeria fusca TaxID=682080 RepID=A0A9P4V551_9PLEO|nr:hypothetical protein EJ04DRAFT_179073 [Polyplosphaeria fusca]
MTSPTASPSPLHSPTPPPPALSRSISLNYRSARRTGSPPASMAVLGARADTPPLRREQTRLQATFEAIKKLVHGLRWLFCVFVRVGVGLGGWLRKISCGGSSRGVF